MASGKIRILNVSIIFVLKPFMFSGTKFSNEAVRFLQDTTDLETDSVFVYLFICFSIFSWQIVIVMNYIQYVHNIYFYFLFVLLSECSGQSFSKLIWYIYICLVVTPDKDCGIMVKNHKNKVTFHNCNIRLVDLVKGNSKLLSA